MKFTEKLKELNACDEAVEWVHKRGLYKAWKECERGDWMLWYISRNKKELGLEDMRIITKAKAKCASLVRHLMQDARSKKALDIAIKFGEGIATREELNAAESYAAAAYYSAESYSAAAYYSAYSAYSAAAAYSAYAAAAYSAYAARRKETLSKCADICREVFKEVI